MEAVAQAPVNATRDIAATIRKKVVHDGQRRFGLVIGIEQYRDARLNLRCARADAQTVYDLMVDPDCGAFDPENVSLLINEKATRENIWRALSKLRRNVGENDTLWIYFAGHAAPEGDGVYWVTYDAEIDDLFGTALSGNQLNEVLQGAPAERKVLFLDCCHASATALRKDPTRAAFSANETFAAFSGKGLVTLASSQDHEKAVELSDKGHGAFTYYLAQGLRGAADTENAGVVTMDHLWHYLSDKVTAAARQAGQRQTPQLSGEMTHNFPLTLNMEALRRRSQGETKIKSLVGLGDDLLTTDEGALCIELLWRAPANIEERAVSSALPALLRGTLAVPEFRPLVEHALRCRQNRPESPWRAPQSQPARPQVLESPISVPADPPRARRSAPPEPQTQRNARAQRQPPIPPPVQPPFQAAVAVPPVARQSSGIAGKSGFDAVLKFLAARTRPRLHRRLVIFLCLVFLYPVGLIMLWASPRWTAGRKLFYTVLSVPGVFTTIGFGIFLALRLLHH